MEELIKQAFMQVDVLGPHVQEGHYDLIGPDGEILLPSVWEKVVQPDWAITMTMWPMDKAPSLGPRIPAGMHHPGVRHGMPPPPPMPGVRMGGMHGPQPRPRSGPEGVMPPPGWHERRPRPSSGVPVGVDIVTVGPKEKKKDKRRDSAMLGFLAGKSATKKK